MVAGFKSKATRKHTYTKVKQKQKNNLKYVNMKRLVKDPVLKKNWDNKKSLKQNLESIPMTSYADQLPEKIESTTELRLDRTEFIVMSKLNEIYGDDVVVCRDYFLFYIFVVCL
eukprot:GHVR01152339.1.p1 GENE.GHVR01152339.1~~GHVR01152339.1.p1  ORF type:complete len:114 (+),score=9.96 GHVR01152339.1:51-392(+)